jgi:hypothetical protein
MEPIIQSLRIVGILPAVCDVSGNPWLPHHSPTSPLGDVQQVGESPCTALWHLHLCQEDFAVSLDAMLAQPHNQCCEEMDYVANLDEPDYKASLFAGLDSLRRVFSNATFVTLLSTIKPSCV